MEGGARLRVLYRLRVLRRRRRGWFLEGPPWKLRRDASQSHNDVADKRRDPGRTEAERPDPQGS